MSHPRATTPRRPEARLEAEILLRLGCDPRIALYKNESGQGYYGNIKPQLCNLLARLPALREQVEQLLYRSRVVYGLGPGSPDLVGIGLGPCPHCAGVVPGMFKGLEEKSLTGRMRDSQVAWHAAARARGARVEVVRSVEAAREVMGLLTTEVAPR